MTVAMAWRVKYRRLTPDGKVVFEREQIQRLGTHQKNRGGVYAAGVRCKSLRVEIIAVNGFVKEEVQRCFVTVQETPAGFVRRRGTDYDTGAAYNIECCSKDELLQTCFSAPYNDVRQLLLRHNHIMLVTRAFLTKAKWDLEPDEGKGISRSSRGAPE